jgi:cytochrome c-type biogenesis protein CcmH/NrfF
MHRLKRSPIVRGFVVLLLAAAAVWAQSEAEINSDEVKRVGNHLSCQCGSCTENLNCQMSSGQCHFCKPARTKIFKMQRAGMNDDQIIAGFIRDYGQAIFRADPNSFFWLIPYVSLAAGGFVVWFVIKRLMGPSVKLQTAGGPMPVPDDDPVLARYRDEIERETEKENDRAD